MSVAAVFDCAAFYDPAPDTCHTGLAPSVLERLWRQHQGEIVDMLEKMFQHVYEAYKVAKQCSFEDATMRILFVCRPAGRGVGWSGAGHGLCGDWDGNNCTHVRTCVRTQPRLADRRSREW